VYDRTLTTDASTRLTTTPEVRARLNLYRQRAQAGEPMVKLGAQYRLMYERPGFGVPIISFQDMC
jgi:hypothetical protein